MRVLWIRNSWNSFNSSPSRVFRQIIPSTVGELEQQPARYPARLRPPGISWRFVQSGAFFILRFLCSASPSCISVCTFASPVFAASSASSCIIAVKIFRLPIIISSSLVDALRYPLSPLFDEFIWCGLLHRRCWLGFYALLSRFVPLESRRTFRLLFLNWGRCG